MTPRRGCALSLFLALVGAALLLFVFVLVLQGEVRIGKRPNFRIWLVRESVNQGIGVSTTRKASAIPADAVGFCQETAVAFLLWRSAGDIQNTSYCECYTEQGGFLGACPPSDD